MAANDMGMNKFIASGSCYYCCRERATFTSAIGFPQLNKRLYND